MSTPFSLAIRRKRDSLAIAIEEGRMGTVGILRVTFELNEYFPKNRERGSSSGGPLPKL